VSTTHESRVRVLEPVAAAAISTITLITGVATVLATFALGFIAKIGPVARLDLKVDEHIALHDRSSLLTTLLKTVSTVATPEIFGPVALVGLPLILLTFRRKLAAVMVFCTVGGALALTEVAKKLVGEPRPPAALRLMTADSGASYPSGHTTVAAALAVALIMVATTLTWRFTALILAGGFAVAVAASRVYLGDHYPLDVLGAMLSALAAGFIVAGLRSLPALRPLVRRLR
jgi:membrane-associated phospholipid phosphatase